MSDFIRASHWVQTIPAAETFSFTCVGYDDFHVTEPLKVPHVQNFYTLHYVLRGSGHLGIGGRFYDISAGQLFFIPPGVEMVYFPNEQSPWEYVWFSTHHEEICVFAREMGFLPEQPVVTSSAPEHVWQRLQTLFRDFSDDAADQYEILSVFFEIVHTCTRSVRSSDTLKAFRRSLDANYTIPNLSLAALCRDVGISHQQMCRQFKTAYGQTAVDYLIAKRIAHACELLAETNMPVYSVAYSCGYTEVSYFIRLFHKKMGCSATEYRRRKREQQESDVIESIGSQARPE